MFKTLAISALLIVTSISKLGFSQAYGNATVEVPACIVLNPSETLVSDYEMSITPLGFTSEKELNVWCGHYSNNLITLSGNYDLGKAYISLHSEFLSEPKNLIWWNDYLAELCTYYIEN